MKKKIKRNIFDYIYLFLIISFFLVDIWLIIASNLKNDRLMFISGILNLLVFLFAIFIYIKQTIISKEENSKLKNVINNLEDEIINSTKFLASKENEKIIVKGSQDKNEEKLNKNIHNDNL